MKNILVKFPTRERPHRFLQVLTKYMTSAHDNEHITYLITCDNDDPQGHHYQNIAKTLQESYKNVIFVFGTSTGKIDAVNRDMDIAAGPDIGWEILVLASDDMAVQCEGWDNIIRKDMMEYFGPPAKGGVLWYDDGFKTAINCMPIMGRTQYDVNGYIYHPAYESLFCDNEFTEVWSLLKLQIKIDRCLFLHEHYARHKKYHHTLDALMKRNESKYAADQKIYERRKAANFDLLV